MTFELLISIFPTNGNHDLDIEGFQRGYECLRSQNFEKRTMGDLKEGYYLGKNLPSDDPLVLQRRFGQAPNKYPTEVHDPEKFQSVMEEYHSVMSTFATHLMQVIACTLDLKKDYFNEFCDHPVAILRLLHYPPQDPTTVETERGKLSGYIAIYVLYIIQTDFLLRYRCSYRFRRSHHASTGQYRRTPSMEQHLV